MKNLNRFATLQLLVATAVAFPSAEPQKVGTTEKVVNVSISGGYQTVAADRGRPVVLIAAALGVKDEVFRDAFSRVHPAPGGREPDPRDVNRNKQVLLAALSKFGITNERLDQVSNFYRCRPGEMWRYQPAEIAVTMVGNSVKQVSVVRSGFGYSSKPTLSIPGHPEIRLDVTLSFGKDFATNGSIKQVTVAGKSHTLP